MNISIKGSYEIGQVLENTHRLGKINLVFMYKKIRLCNRFSFLLFIISDTRNSSSSCIN